MVKLKSIEETARHNRVQEVLQGMQQVLEHGRGVAEILEKADGTEKQLLLDTVDMIVRRQESREKAQQQTKSTESA